MKPPLLLVASASENSVHITMADLVVFLLVFRVE